MDHRGTALVRFAIMFRQRRFFADQNRRHVDAMADGAARWREQFHPAGLSGVLSRELHEPLGTRPHGQDGFPAAAAHQHAFHRLAAAGGFGRVRQRALRHGRDALRGGATAPASDVRAARRLQRVVRRGNHHPLLADVHAGGDQLLDGARTRNCLWLLQSLQYRADAGRGVSRRVQGGFYFRAAGAARLKCSCARAGGQGDFAGGFAGFARLGNCVVADLRVVLENFRAPLHERKLLKNRSSGRESARSPPFELSLVTSAPTNCHCLRAREFLFSAHETIIPAVFARRRVTCFFH